MTGKKSSRAIVLSILVLVLALFFPANIKAKPIDFSNSPLLNVYSDQTAHEVGDIITIVVSDTLTNNRNSQVKIQKNFSIPVPTGGGLFHFLGGILSARGSSNANSQRQFQDQNTLTTTFTVRVAAVEPNGNLDVTGTHEVVVNNEKEAITLTGVIRQKDITATNTVSSSQVADMKINVQGKGNSEGIISKILRFLF